MSRQSLPAAKGSFGIVGAVLAAALLAGCGGGGANEQVYSIGPTADCLRAEGERAVPNRNDPSILELGRSFVRFHPSIEAAKDFDVSKLNASFAGYEFHRIRHGNVSLVWATGGPNHFSGPPKSQLETAEHCLRT
jgi:hypothetical protein